MKSLWEYSMNSSNPEETRITSKESQNLNKVSFKIISFRIVSKITANCKGNGLTIAKFHHIFLKVLDILKSHSRRWLPKLSQQTKTFAKFTVKSTILPQLMSFWSLEGSTVKCSVKKEFFFTRSVDTVPKGRLLHCRYLSCNRQRKVYSHRRLLFHQFLLPEIKTGLFFREFRCSGEGNKLIRTPRVTRIL